MTRLTGLSLYSPQIKAKGKTCPLVPLPAAAECAVRPPVVWRQRQLVAQALPLPGAKATWVIQISRPYLSVADSRMCITLSQTVKVGSTLYVFCCDLDWRGEGSGPTTGQAC